MKLFLVVNPNAGKKNGRAVADQVTRIFESGGISVESSVSDHPGGTREIAEQIEQADWDGVVAVGGDGTLFEVINGLVRSSSRITVPLGQIPVGTGNSFIRDLHPRYEEGPQKPEPVEDAARKIMSGSTRKVDLGHFTSDAGEYYFINLLGAGFVSNVAYRSVKYKRLGSFSYILGVIEEVIGLKSTMITLEIDGRVVERDAVFVEICNSRFTGGSMLMAPSAEIDDGQLDIVLLNKVPRRALLWLLPAVFSGKHVEADVVEVFRGRHITVRSESPLALTPDGETFGTTPLEVSVFHHMVEMFG